MNIYMKKKVTHFYMCITVHLKMMPSKYLGKADIPIYSKVVNKLNSGNDGYFIYFHVTERRIKDLKCWIKVKY